MPIVNIRLLLSVTLFFVLLFVLSGCQSSSNTANLKRINDNTIDVSHPRAELVLASKRLVGVVALTDVRFGSVVNFQRVQVGLQNISGRELSLDYKVEWQDDQGFAVNQNTIWHPIKLGAREIYHIKSLGKVQEAYQIQLTVRFSD